MVTENLAKYLRAGKFLQPPPKAKDEKTWSVVLRTAKQKLRRTQQNLAPAEFAGDRRWLAAARIEPVSVSGCSSATTSTLRMRKLNQWT
jgi:hypothetical protein